MARIKLELPEQFSFSTELTVRISEINYGRHLGNDALLALVQEARIQCLKQHGFCEGDAGGAGMIMSDAAVVYKSQAFHGDVLKIEVAVADFSRSGCDFVFRITQAKTGAEVARAKTGIVFFDYAAQKVRPVPEAFKAAFGAAS